MLLTEIQAWFKGLDLLKEKNVNQFVCGLSFCVRVLDPACQSGKLFSKNLVFPYHFHLPAHRSELSHVNGRVKQPVFVTQSVIQEPKKPLLTTAVNL